MSDRPLLFDNPICLSRVHCGTCRMKEDGHVWRQDLLKYFSVPSDNPDFECPYGMKWDFAILTVKSRPIVSKATQAAQQKNVVSGAACTPCQARREARAAAMKASLEKAREGKQDSGGTPPQPTV